MSQIDVARTLLMLLGNRDYGIAEIVMAFGSANALAMRTGIACGDWRVSSKSTALSAVIESSRCHCRGLLRKATRVSKRRPQTGLNTLQASPA